MSPCQRVCLLLRWWLLGDPPAKLLIFDSDNRLSGYAVEESFPLCASSTQRLWKCGKSAHHILIVVGRLTIVGRSLTKTT